MEQTVYTEGTLVRFSVFSACSASETAKWISVKFCKGVDRMSSQHKIKGSSVTTKYT